MTRKTKTTRKTKNTMQKDLQDLLAIAARPAVASEPKVGIRNVSDYTVGIKGRFGEPDVQLHAAFGPPTPGQVHVISWSFWRDLCKEEIIAKGMVIRDDSILGPGYTAAPADGPNDIPASAAANVIMDPMEWVESRTEEQIRNELPKFTSLPSLRRIRRAVDLKLKDLEKQYDHLTNDERVQLAWQDLPGKYRLVEEITTRLIEKPTR